MTTKQYISVNISMPEDVGRILDFPFNENLLLATAANISKNLSMSTSSDLAGRLFMYAKLQGSANTVEEYVDALGHRLNNEFVLFITRNKEKINECLRQHEYKNYINFDYISANKMCGSYLLTPDFGDFPEETPQFMYLRIAVQLFCRHSVEKCLQKFLEMSEQYYTHASPALFNAGTRDKQMISCFLLTFGDSLESIQATIADCAIISKHMGGIGLDGNNVRHSEIGYIGMSGGVMPYVRTSDVSFLGANQGGKRPGAGTIFLRDWHIDILELMESCASTAPSGMRIDNYTGCVWASRLFFRRVREDGDWTFFCPANAKLLNNKYNDEFEELYSFYESEAPKRKEIYLDMKQKCNELKKKMIETGDSVIRKEYNSIKRKKVEYRKENLINYRRMKARDVMKILTTNQLKKTFYIMNGDSVNMKCNMSNIGTVNSSNLCLEIIEPTTEDSISSCNLVSMNLTKYCLGKVDYKKIDLISDEEIKAELRKCYDFTKLGEMTQSVVENLNQVIDFNDYPLDKIDVNGNIIRGKISTTNFRNRPVGIGVSGLNDAFLNLDLIYSSRAAEIFNKMIFATMYYNGLVSSLNLALQNPEGAYASFRTGECSIFNEGTLSFEKKKGSPLSNGIFQFDMWRKFASYLKNKGDLTEHYDYYDEDGNLEEREIVYDVNDDTPLDPEDWGQPPVKIFGRSRSGDTVDEILLPDWDKLRNLIIKYGVRNSMLLALMPTASTAEILRNTETTEAHQQLIYSRKVKDGNFTVVVKQLRDDLNEIGLWNEDVVNFIMGFSGSIQHLDYLITNYPHLVPDFNGNWERVKYLKEKHKTMFELSQKVIIRHARQRGIYVDQSQSMNIYLSHDRSNQETLEYLHQYTNAMTLKTQIYYLRQLPAREASKLTLPSHIRKIISEISSKEGKIEPEEEEENYGECTMKEGCIMCSS